MELRPVDRAGCTEGRAGAAVKNLVWLLRTSGPEQKAEGRAEGDGARRSPEPDREG